MNRSHLIFVAALLVNIVQMTGQTILHDSLFAALGVASVRTVITQNGDTTLKELQRYNPDGYETALHYSTAPGKYNIDIHDTLIIRSGEYYSLIDHGDRRSYDSSHTIHHVGSADTITTTYFKRGKVVLQYITVSTKESDKTHRIYSDESRCTIIQTETRTFDKQGRLLEKVTSDTLVKGKNRKEQSNYHYFYEYTSLFEIQTVYKSCGDSTCNSYTSYHTLNNSYDSCIMYTDNKVEWSSAIYRDEKGRETLSVSRDANGVITNRNTSVYSPSYARTEHADGSGFVFKTHEWFLNDKGLVVKEVETDHKFGDVRTLYYQYTYY